ncbi:unnamed protein product, partial [Soboliphyme baturini]|uniref:S5A_REDUCTASE domain-containing protein n=1 Tax=Soboliphyme baturini TaxID=241478 RepID=A0A183I9Y4_9BILA
YTPPFFGAAQVFLGLSGFLLAEYGNLSVHLLLRDLRPPGSTERRIPEPNSNWCTGLFRLVCCPNYTYEVLAWLSFSVMTQCLPALIFTLAGGYQMTVWAIGKRRAYLKEFPNFPRNRKAIFPYLL